MDDKSEMPIRPKGKFKKMFPGLKAWSIEGIDWQKFLALYVKFQPDNEMDKGLPAGYTYLGQFISHDLSLDITPLQTFETNAENVDNYRTAAFDLDSVYEYSPASYPAMYDKDRASFLLQNVTITDGNQDFWDMPRDNNRHAIIPDKRNDENIIVSQLHIAFQCLHNKFVKDQKGAKDAYYRFATARNMVIKYYQWIILYDFLGKILGKTKEEIQDLVTSIRSSRRRNGSDAKPGRMPVEFSASAFRFGHSLVR